MASHEIGRGFQELLRGRRWQEPLDAGTPRSYRAGAFLLRRGERGGFLLAPTRGRVKVLAHRADGSHLLLALPPCRSIVVDMKDFSEQRGHDHAEITEATPGPEPGPDGRSGGVGDVDQIITDPRAPVNNGPQFHFNGLSEKTTYQLLTKEDWIHHERAPQRSSEEQLLRLWSRFVAPANHARAAEKSRIHQAVIVTGHPGNGRQTTAKVLLHDAGEARVPYRELSNSVENGNILVLDPETMQQGDRLLLDLSNSTSAALEVVQPQLESFRTELGNRAYLAIVLSSEHEHLLDALVSAADKRTALCARLFVLASDWAREPADPAEHGLRQHTADRVLSKIDESRQFDPGTVGPPKTTEESSHEP